MTRIAATAGWSRTQRAMHWGMFLIVLAAVALVLSTGFYEKGDPQIGTLMFFHKSFGVTAFAGIALWMLVRSRQGRPSAIGRPWQIGLSRWVHGLLVALIFAMPVLGVLMSEFGGRAVSVFGLFTIPRFTPENKDVARVLHTLHAHGAAPVLLALIVLHVIGALWHHLADRDATMARMLWTRPANGVARAADGASSGASR
ncbi:MAG TPA: cytochrome b [Nevskiaceae bacterium]